MYATGSSPVGCGTVLVGTSYLSPGAIVLQPLANHAEADEPNGERRSQPMSRRRLSATLLGVAVFLCALPGALIAQGTLEDYLRADSFAVRTRDLVIDVAEEPHWIGESSRFWMPNAILRPVRLPACTRWLHCMVISALMTCRKPGVLMA